MPGPQRQRKKHSERQCDPTGDRGWRPAWLEAGTAASLLEQRPAAPGFVEMAAVTTKQETRGFPCSPGPRLHTLASAPALSWNRGCVSLGTLVENIAL